MIDRWKELHPDYSLKLETFWICTAKFKTQSSEILVSFILNSVQRL